MNIFQVNVTGDTNIDLLKINENHVFYAAFKLLIALPTRLSNWNFLISNMFTYFTNELFSDVLSSYISDHQMYYIAQSFFY